MKKKEHKKISLFTYIVCVLIALIIDVAMVYFIVQDSINKNKTTDSYTSVKPISIEKEEAKTKVEEQKEKDYFILYDGIEMDIKTGVQDLSDMEINEENSNKYNRTYYNYEKGEYLGEKQGDFGEETYIGMSVVGNLDRIAISEKYDAIPRKFTRTEELPQELSDMEGYSSVKIDNIDLDNDGKMEHIVCCTTDNKEGELKASSSIMLYDSNYKKVANLVNLENGFWANIKEEDRKVFLSLDDVDYIDIDNDGIMEVITKVPVYEGTRISVIKYNNNKVQGETNIEANLGA